MRYQGGKHKAGPHIAKILADAAVQHNVSVYREPFFGAGSVLYSLLSHKSFSKVHANDLRADLMVMWDEAVHNGWDPPQEISRERWLELKFDDMPSAEKAFAGFAQSFAAVYFASYAVGDSYTKAGRRAVLKKAECFKRANIEFTANDYRECKPDPGDLVYCDPPYFGVSKIRGMEFDSLAFWETMEQWSEVTPHLFISEYWAPDGWQCVWEMKTPGGASSYKRNYEQTERLWQRKK